MQNGALGRWSEGLEEVGRNQGAKDLQSSLKWQMKNRDIDHAGG